MRIGPQPVRDLRRARCGDDSHGGFGRRPEETGWSKGQHRASGRPHFKASVVDHGAILGIDVEIVVRNPEQTGFVPQAKRFVVEQTNGVLVYDRYLVREYTVDPRSSESRVYWASARRIVRRLTGTITPSWRTHRR